MSSFDYTAQAELFPAKARGMRRQAVSYMKFDSAADAVRYAIEVLEPALLMGAVLEVDEQRFDSIAIKNLYADANYPFKRVNAASGGK
jgi:hypothetical protein